MALRVVAVLMVAFLLSYGSGEEVDCPPCDLQSCGDPGQCPAGQVTPGPCPCCPVCALDEGAACFNESIKGLPRPPKGRELPCGENMACLLRQDLAPRDEPEALCMCRQTESVCGSNNQTYESICALRSASAKGGHRGGPLYMKSWGPCKAAPWLTSSPDDALGSLGQGLALSCEARGYPIPDIHWEFVGDNNEIKNLPSDDLYVAVQVRGGPEPFMVSSWAQIVSLRPTDTGTYTCVATNPEGSARASATVGVYKQKHPPGKKVHKRQ